VSALPLLDAWKDAELAALEALRWMIDAVAGSPRQAAAGDVAEVASPPTSLARDPVRLL
jgi:hypothetical protein